MGIGHTPFMRERHRGRRRGRDYEDYDGVFELGRPSRPWAWGWEPPYWYYDGRWRRGRNHVTFRDNMFYGVQFGRDNQHMNERARQRDRRPPPWARPPYDDEDDERPPYDDDYPDEDDYPPWRDRRQRWIDDRDDRPRMLDWDRPGFNNTNRNMNTNANMPFW